MKTAVFADIHGNLEALETAAADAEKRGVERIAVLGDLVGYGANPNECAEWAAANAAFCVMGNHEKAVLDPGAAVMFNSWAFQAAEWTRQNLEDCHRAMFLEYPYLRIEKAAAYTHGSFETPEQFHYLFGCREAAPSFLKLDCGVGFFGHTHVPCCMTAGPESFVPLFPGILRLQSGKKYLLNPGSIGQPRDRDSRLSYGIFDDRENWFELVRLAYDYRRAAAKILKAGLPAYLAARLCEGQ